MRAASCQDARTTNVAAALIRGRLEDAKLILVGQFELATEMKNIFEDLVCENRGSLLRVHGTEELCGKS